MCATTSHINCKEVRSVPGPLFRHRLHQSRYFLRLAHTPTIKQNTTQHGKSREALHEERRRGRAQASERAHEDNCPRSVPCLNHDQQKAQGDSDLTDPQDGKKKKKKVSLHQILRHFATQPSHKRENCKFVGLVQVLDVTQRTIFYVTLPLDRVGYHTTVSETLCAGLYKKRLLTDLMWKYSPVCHIEFASTINIFDGYRSSSLGSESVVAEIYHNPPVVMKGYSQP